MKSACMIILSVFVWAGSAVAWQTVTDCRANIKAATCRVNPFVNDNEDDHGQRPCLGGEEKYVSEIENAYDLMPKKIQKVFCSLRRIYIEESFYATGYASYITDLVTDNSGNSVWKANGLVIGLNKFRLFESGWTLSEWTTRKEMTLLGLQMTDSIPVEFPRFQVDLLFPKLQMVNTLLYSILLHEIGHVVDYMLDIVKRDVGPCLDSSYKRKAGCKPDYVGLWTSLSWTAQGQILPEFKISMVPCYYKCSPGPRLSMASANDYYFGLSDTGQFVSPYAAVNPSEDFADTFHNFFLEDSRYRQNEHYFLMVSGAGQYANFTTFRLRGKGRNKYEFMGFVAESPWPDNMPDNYQWPFTAQAPDIPRRILD